MARDELTTESFRARMESDIRAFNTRKEFDPAAWANLATRLHYTSGEFGDPAAFSRLHDLVTQLDTQANTLTLDDDTVIPYDDLLIATGSSPVRAPGSSARRYSSPWSMRSPSE